MTTKTEALALYGRACQGEASWEAAARALAAALAPIRAIKRGKNKRQGPGSKAFPGLRLPLYTKQACGHTFNSAGCAVCPTCPREPARVVAPYRTMQDPINERVIAERIAMDLAEAFGRLAWRLKAKEAVVAA